MQRKAKHYTLFKDITLLLKEHFQSPETGRIVYLVRKEKSEILSHYELNVSSWPNVLIEKIKDKIFIAEQGELWGQIFKAEKKQE